MKVNLNIKDVRLEDTANSSGSIGSLVANITWSSEGIKQTIQDAIPLVGSFVTGVTTNPSAGTIELEGALGSIVAKPEVVDNGHRAAGDGTDRAGLHAAARDGAAGAGRVHLAADQELSARHPRGLACRSPTPVW